MPLPDYDDLCRYALKSSVIFTTGNQTITGNKTFLGATVLSGNSTPLTITNTEGSKTINLGNAGGVPDFGTQILISSGFATPTAVLRAGVIPSTYGYGLVFGGGVGNSKKGYLTAANTLFPTGLSDATLVWTDRILSGQWRTNQRLLVNETGVVLSGEAATPANLASTGSTLQTNINSLSGYVNSPLSNIVFTTGNQSITGNKTFVNSGVFSISGVSPLPLPNNPLSVVGSGSGYVQINIQNRATGVNATADVVITANNGTDTANFINLGINNSGYNDPAFSNGSGYDGYLFINGGNLDIGTQTTGTFIEFHAGGTTFDKTIARINETGLTVGLNNDLFVNTITDRVGVRTATPDRTFDVNGSGIFRNNLDVSGNLFISGNYNVYNNIEITKRLALAYAIAL